MFNFFFSLDGRVGRLQWWVGSLPIWAILCMTALLIQLLFGGLADESAEKVQQVFSSNLRSVLWVVLWGVELISLILLLWVNFSLTVRRYHDRDKSGWWFLIAFIPLFWIWQLIECGFFPGSPGGNSYGQGIFNSGDLDPEISRMREARNQRLGIAQPSFTENPKKTSQPVRSNNGRRNGFGRRGQQV